MTMKKSIYLVGGSSGIAAALVRKLDAEGHQITVASRHANGIDTLANVTHYEFDATASGAELPGVPDVLNGLVYAPGSIRLKPFHRISEEEFREDWEINFMGAVRAIQQAIRPLRKAKGASVVLFSTVAVQRGMGFHGSIASAKAAVEGLTRSLAAEYANAKIRFNAVAPSLTDTPLANELLSTEQKREGAEKRHPLGRFGEAEDIAAAAHFLLTDSSSWMTGQILGVDGGLSVI